MRKPIVQSLLLKIIYKGFLFWFLKLFVGVRFDKTKFLKKERQFIILANHNSHLDALSLMASLPSNLLWRTKPVAAEDYFGNTKLKAKLSNYLINTLLIRRKGERDVNHDPIDEMLKALDKGYSLILFPEGTRGEAEVMDKIKPGIGKILSLRPHIPYIPVYLSGMGKSLPKGESIILPYNSSVNYGKVTPIKSNNISEILEQIYQDFKIMQEQYKVVIKNDEEDDLSS